MSSKATAVIQSNIWRALKDKSSALSSMNLRNEFATDTERFKRFSTSFDGLLFDYSKNHIDGETRDLLLKLLQDNNLDEWRHKLFSGAVINNSENRSVLHTALRDPNCDVVVDGEHVGDFVHGVLARMQKFSVALREGDYRGHMGDQFTDIVNIGIGGSDLGPHMVCEALQPYARSDIQNHYVSNVDARHLLSVIDRINAETTMFIIASKTYTTQETMTNAHRAKEWLIEQLGGQAVSKHFVAVTSNNDGAIDFGIEAQNIFPLRSWIGGRYSLWSAIGLPICLSAGYENFYRLLKGAHAMDSHFLETPLEENIPALMAAIGLWNNNFRGYEAQAILPYSYDLRRLPAYIQQLDMESNGKSVTRDGQACSALTSPIVFGEQGPNGQHAFYQAIHQGMHNVACDFIGIVRPEHGYEDHHRKLLANMVGQSQALMEGRIKVDEPHRYFAGNKASTTILLERLDPYHLGMLLSAYEHKVFVQGIVWGINSYDQWGVELGKELTNSILSERQEEEFDSSTQGLINHIEHHKNR